MLNDIILHDTGNTCMLFLYGLSGLLRSKKKLFLYISHDEMKHVSSNV